MSSSSLIWMATESRFCVFWIKKTIRKVTTVVAVLMTSCQVSLNPKIGPVTAHRMMITTAATNVAGWPEKWAVHLAKWLNREVDEFETTRPAIFVQDVPRINSQGPPGTG